EQDHRLLCPPKRVQRAQEIDRMPKDLAEPNQSSRDAATSIREQRAKKTHRVGAGGIANRFDVRVIIDVYARSDRDTPGVIDRIPPGRRTDDRLAVGADGLAQPGR